jgi:hypothetical protein
VEDRPSELGRVHFDLDNHADVRAAAENREEIGNAGAGQLVCIVMPHWSAQRSRAIERLIMMDDDPSIPGRTDIELDAVGSERQPVCKRVQRIFRGEGSSTAVREDQRFRCRKEAVSHAGRSV